MRYVKLVSFEESSDAVRVRFRHIDLAGKFIPLRPANLPDAIFCGRLFLFSFIFWGDKSRVRVIVLLAKRKSFR